MPSTQDTSRPAVRPAARTSIRFAGWTPARFAEALAARALLLAALAGLGAAPAAFAGIQTQDLTTSLTPADLALELVGTDSDATISNVSFQGDPTCAGTFLGGGGILGFEAGIVLGAGMIGDVVGPNDSDNTQTDFGTPGDADLDTLVTDTITFDACVLEFDLECPGEDVVSFEYVFTSEEYNEFSNTQFNNVFGFFLNGSNIAVLPGSGTPVEINTVNGGNPFGTNAQNPSFFINNDLQDGGGDIDIEADGLTVVLGAEASIGTGTNHLKIAIADSGDALLDSWVFLKRGSLQCAPLPQEARTQLPAAGEETDATASDALNGSAIDGAGDLNHDGTPDFISGAPGFRPNASGGGPVEAGAVLVYFGNPASAERGRPDLRFECDAAHDRCGSSVAGGFDYNGDGTPDLLIGAEQVNRTGVNDPVAGCDAGDGCGPGKAIVVFFDPADPDRDGTVNDYGADGTTDVVSLSSVGTAGGVPGVVFVGEAIGDQAGFAVDGGGRVNATPGQDLLIGAPGADVVDATAALLPNAGKVYVVFDDASLADTTASLADIAGGTLAGTVFVGAAAGDALGTSVLFPGDVVGNPADDLALGAPGFDPEDPAAGPLAQGTITDAGGMFVPEGGDLDNGRTIEVCRVGEPGQVGSSIFGTQNEEEFASSVGGGGDPSGGGFSDGPGDNDLLVGAPGFDAPGAPDAGRVVQTFSRLPVGQFSASHVGDPNPSNPDAIDGVRWIGVEAGAALGTSAAVVGNTTGNCCPDTALGAPFADPLDTADAGIVYLVEGDPSYTGRLGSVRVTAIGATRSGRQLAGTQEGELAGIAVVAIDDVDSDGTPDFAVGSPGKDADGSVDSGTVTVVTESDGLAFSTGNSPPLADAGPDQVLECSGNLKATATLNGSMSSDPDSSPLTNNDIAAFLWSEPAVPRNLGEGEIIASEFGLGSHDVSLEVRDSAGASGTDTANILVQDTLAPTGGLTGPVNGSCTNAVPVLITDAFTDPMNCDPNLARTYSPPGDPPGNSYSTEGDYSVNVSVQDVSGNAGPSTDVSFIIDLTDPDVQIANGPFNVASDLPISMLFTSSDSDGASGGVVREIVKFDNCVGFDGSIDGDGDGLLSDETLLLDGAEFCRIAEKCGLSSLISPTVTVEATDCAGNLGTATQGWTGSLALFPGLCSSITVTLEGEVFTSADWDPVGGAVHYDVVRGDLANLQASGSQVNLGPTLCIEVASGDTSTAGGHEDPAQPRPGQAFFYLVQSSDGAVDSGFGYDSSGRDRIQGGSTGTCN